MTPPPGPGASAAARPPLLLLGLLYAIPFVVAAVTPFSDFMGGPQGDVRLYLDRAHELVAGRVPYRDFPLEYPPLALLPMVVPYVLWPFGPAPVNVYPWLFAGEMAVLLVALALVVGQVARLRSSWGPGPHGAPGAPGEAEWRAPATLQRDVALRLLILAAGAALALTWRFDLFPALLAIVAVWAALEHRPVIAGVAIGAGVLAKLFPIVVAPAIAVIWLAPLDWARLARFAWAAGITLVLGLAPFVALARGDALSFIGYQAARGLQVESVGGGLVLLLGLITGEPNRLVSPFSAWEVTGPVAEALLALSSAALVGGFLVLAALGWRLVRAEAEGEGATSPATVVLLATAAILLLVLTSKVFSIQYVVWLLPFAALLPWRRFWLVAAAIALSIPIHPVLYEALVRQEALPILVLNLRNALLLALLAWVLWDLARSSPRPPAV